jgi:hypothetical protein
MDREYIKIEDITRRERRKSRKIEKKKNDEEEVGNGK